MTRRTATLLAWALPLALLLAACGGGGKHPSPIAQLSDNDLRTGIAEGMTRDLRHSASDLSETARRAPAMDALGQVRQVNGLPWRTLRRARAADASGSTGSAQLDYGLDFLTKLVTQSTVSRSGNTVTIDPDETRLCLQLPFDDATRQRCTELLSHLLLVVTVHETSGNRVTAATVDFRYRDASVVVADFTPTTSAHELRLAGLKPLLADLAVSSGSSVDLPDVMTGSLRLAFDMPDARRGSVTLSVPEAIRIEDAAEAFDFRFAATERLLSLAFDADALTASLTVAVDSLDFLGQGEDAGGSFPVRLTLQSLTGGATLDENGQRLTLTSVGLGSFTLQVDGQQALHMSLASLDALLDASGSAPFLRLDKALDFQLQAHNLRGVFADTLFADASNRQDPNLQLTASATAPAGAVFTEVSDGVLRVTGLGAATFHAQVDSDVPGDDLLLDVAEDGCFRLSDMAEVSCP